jgi:hypothetical protein
VWLRVSGLGPLEGLLAQPEALNRVLVQYGNQLYGPNPFAHTRYKHVIIACQTLGRSLCGHLTEAWDILRAWYPPLSQRHGGL